MKIKRKSKKRRDIIEERAFIKAITRLRRGDQYLKTKKERSHLRCDVKRKQLLGNLRTECIWTSLTWFVFRLHLITANDQL